jgi:predicted nucleic acid-binding protein
MNMSSKVFVDSSVLIEPVRNNKVQFYIDLVTNDDYLCCINSIIVSEYLYKYVGLQGIGSPRAIQERNEIHTALKPYFVTETLKDFLFVEPDTSILQSVPRLMARYNLLANDAIIIATCRMHNINQLALHDADFKNVCEQEGIVLLKE